jgi:Protein of unknown function (DUF2946)
LRHGGTRHWAAPFVLAMLCLRAFIPAGFMLAPVDGRLAVVLCDSDAPGAIHHHGGHEHSGHHHTQTDPTCPYAQSAGPAPLPTLPALAAAQIVSVAVRPVETAQTHVHFGPTRQQFPRGPPRLA